MPFHDLESGTLRAYDPRRDTALGFSPTPEFYSDMASLWGGARTAAEVIGVTAGAGGLAGAFTRLPLKLKKTLEALARTRSRNIERPDMAPDLVNEGWEALLESPKGRGATGPLLKDLWARTSPPPVEKFSEKDDPSYAKILTAIARNAMRQYIWKNANPVEEPATISKLRATLNRVEQRHLARTGFAPSDQELGAQLGLSPDRVRMYRSSSSLGPAHVPIDPMTGELVTQREASGPPRAVPRELTVLPQFRVEGPPAGSTPEAALEAIAKTPVQKQVLDLYRRGVSDAQAAKTLGVSQRRIEAIKARLRSMGAVAQQKTERAKTGMTEQVIRRYENDAPLSEIVATLGVTEERAREILETHRYRIKVDPRYRARYRPTGG